MQRRIALTLAGWLTSATLVLAQEPATIDVGISADILPTVPETTLRLGDITPPTIKPVSNDVRATPVSTAAPCNSGWWTSCDNGCDTGRAGRFYGSVDYLLFNFRDGPAPALIQTLPAQEFQNMPPDASRAQLLYGDGIRHHAFSGVSIRAGAWVNDCWALEGSVTDFETKSKDYFIASPGNPSVGRYYFDITNNDRPNTYLIYSNPDGSTSGYINVASPTRFWHADANVRFSGNAVFGDRFDWLVGLRYIDLREGIFIQDYTQANDGSGAAFRGEDNFYVTNQFYGAQIGGNSWYDFGGGWSLDATFKLGFGGVRQRASIQGFTEQIENGVVIRRVPGDVLTQPTNIGEYDRGHFAVAPELTLKLGYRISSRLHATVGYNIIAVSNVVRAGSIIDDNINPNVNPFLIPNANSNEQRPGFGWNGTDFWAQGITAGFTLTY